MKIVTDSESLFRIACGHCKNDRPLTWEKPYSQWIHSWKEGTLHKVSICLATNLRVKYGPKNHKPDEL